VRELLLTGTYRETRCTKGHNSTGINAQTIESILEDRRNNTVYTAVAWRRLTYYEMLALVRRFYHRSRPDSRTWLKNYRIRILTDIGLED
jgi:hypothetical protein